ncbi:MAG: hypothetical protein AAFQ36_10245 [Pseudomonadota bacterium]
MRQRTYQLTFALTVLGVAAVADTPVDLEWFEEYAQGSTLHFERGGDYAGAEQFLDDRRVIWQFPDGTCVPGGWYIEAGAMCFVYAHSTDDPQCWQMLQVGDDIIARLVNAENDTGDIRITRQTNVPLSCGPASGA